ncbi:MAG TPA: SDR family oxidoreductase, partial [Myxococcales bacterium]|nr:SDR family oxidoreductase [Myxococcales bacterium]
MSPPIARLDVSRVLGGKGVLFAGATGFLGKVALCMLLDRYGDALDKVHVVVRRGSSTSAERRFYDKVVPSEPFQPLRDRLGEQGVVEWLQRKVSILDGDITDPDLGLTAAELDLLAGRAHVLINCAGLVSFNP